MDDRSDSADFLMEESQSDAESNSEFEEDESEFEFVPSSTTVQAVPMSEVAQADSNRLRSLAPFRNALQPFISPKVFQQLTAAISRGKDRRDGAPAIPQPKQVKSCVLRDYQLEGLSWLVANFHRSINCILGDEMGLGKTVQTISLIAHLALTQGVTGPFLVVVPLTVMFNWSSELRRFCPALSVLRVHSSDPAEVQRLKTILRTESHKLHVVLTTYEMLKSQFLATPLRRVIYRAVVLDEGHRIRSEDTEVSKACGALRTTFKLVLTGTPLQNNLKEMGVLLRFLAPNVFTDVGLFDRAFSLGARVNIDRQALDRAHYMVRPFLLRRLKAEVERALPPKVETLVECPMTELQRDITRFLLLRQEKVVARIAAAATPAAVLEPAAAEEQAKGQEGDREPENQKLGRGEGEVSSTMPPGQAPPKRSKRARAELARLAQAGGSSDSRSVLGLLAHLRKAANHPYLFAGIEHVHIDGLPTQEIVAASGKMVMLDRLLRKLLPRQHRVVIFSQFTRTMDIICDYLDMQALAYRRLDGATNRVMREVNVTLFNKRTDCAIFVLSTRAGGEGVNLCSADTVILFDSDWNPQVDIQAMARVHRIGQTKTVHIYRLVTKGSVDECVVHRAQKKLFLDSMVGRGSTANARALDELKRRPQGEATEHVTGTSTEDTPLDATVADDEEGYFHESSSEDGEEPGDVPADLDLTPSQLLAAVKFGWNSAFSATGAAEDVTEEHIDMIIDRGRGLAGPEGKDAAAEDPGVTAPRVMTLSENQEMSIASFDETQPLISVEHIRQQQAQAQLEEPRDAPSAPPARGQDASPEAKRPKRQSVRRTVDVMVEDVGIVSLLQSPTKSAAGHARGAHHREANVLEGFVRRDAPSASCTVAFVRPTGSNKQVAGRDYDHQDFCQVCWNGGKLLLCDGCPCSFHPRCLRMGSVPSGKWLCPQHRCGSCQRSASSAGLLFRCTVCELAYCEDCLPADAEVQGDESRFSKLRYQMPSTCCFIKCGVECASFDDVAALAALDDAVEGGEDDGSADDMDEGKTADPRELDAMDAARLPLQFCALEDIEKRLLHDSQRIHARFTTLAEIPNLDVRLRVLNQSALWALCDVARQVERMDAQLRRAGPDPTPSASASPSDAPSAPVQPRSPPDVAIGSVQEAVAYLAGFSGAHPSLSKADKIAIFRQVVGSLSGLATRLVQAMAPALGICAMTMMRPSRQQPGAKEPKFCFAPNSSPRRAQEEALAALLVVPSPCNLILPGGRGDGTQPDDLLNVSRLLQTLGESVRDENKQYHASMALKDEGYTPLLAWSVHYPRGRPADAETRLRWLIPAARMFEMMTAKDLTLARSSKLMRDLVDAYRLYRGVLVAHRKTAPQLALAAAPALAPDSAPQALAPEKQGEGASVEGAQPDPVAPRLGAELAHDDYGLSAWVPPERAVELLGSYLRGESGSAACWEAYLAALGAEVDAQVMDNYSTQNETIYMMAWLVQAQSARQRFDLPHLTSGLPPAEGSWRATVSPARRQQAIAQLDRLFATNNWKAKIASPRDYANKLQVFELALLTVAPSEELYADPAFVAKHLHAIVNEFQQFVCAQLTARKREELDRRAGLIQLHGDPPQKNRTAPELCCGCDSPYRARRGSS